MVVNTRPEPWKLPAQSTLGNSKCLKKGDEMINAAFVDLKDKYIVPLLDHLLAKILDGSTYSQKTAALDLGSMVVAVDILTKELDGLSTIFARKKLAGAGEGNGEQDDELEGVSTEAAAQIVNYLNRERE